MTTVNLTYHSPGAHNDIIFQKEDTEIMAVEIEPKSKVQDIAHDPPKLSLSVVICAYTEKRWDDIVAAVHSLETQTRVPDEILLAI